MKIKRKSWHYYLANFGNERVCPGQKTNFCSYFWSVFFGLMYFIGFILAIILLVIITIDSYYQFFMYLFYDVKMKDIAIVFVLVTLSAAALIAIGYFFMKYLDYKDSINVPSVEPKEPGFFTLAYRKWKEKTCVLVEIENRRE